MKILFIPSWYPAKNTNDRVAGTFVKEHALAAALYDDIAVLVFRKAGKGFPGVKITHYADSGLHTYEAWITDSIVPKTNRPFLYLNRYIALRKVINMWGAPDLLHSQDTSSFYVYWLSKISGIPYVVSQHWTAFLRRTLTMDQVASFKVSLSSAEFVLPAYFQAAVDYKHYGIDTTVEWMPNTFDTDIFFPNKKPSSNRDLLHVSGFTEQKRVKDVIKAFSISLRSHPEALFHFVGDGRNKSMMMDYAKTILPDHSYTFHGHLDKYSVANLMRKCCGFVFPSEFETFGCVLMEAMACGCPVLTTKTGGIPAVVRENEGIFVDVGDIEAIASGINLMLDGNHNLPLSEIAEQIKKRFSRKKVGEKLHNIYLKANTNSQSGNK